MIAPPRRLGLMLLIASGVFISARPTSAQDRRPPRKADDPAASVPSRDRLREILAKIHEARKDVPPVPDRHEGSDLAPELRRQLIAIRGGFQEIPVGRREQSRFVKVLLNADGAGFDAVRFTTPASGSTFPALWEIVCPGNLNSRSVRAWNIFPVSGDGPRIGGEWSRRDDYPLPGAGFPPDNICIGQDLTGPLLPSTEYVVWFDFKDDKPVTDFVKIRLRSTGSNPQSVRRADDARRTAWSNLIKKSDADRESITRPYVAALRRALNDPRLDGGDAEHQRIAAELDELRRGDEAMADNRWLRIVRAEFGEGSRWIDVTDQIKPLVRGRTLRFTLEWGMINTDPAPGVSKTLVILYEMDGRAGVSITRELQQVELPPARGQTDRVPWINDRDGWLALPRPISGGEVGEIPPEDPKTATFLGEAASVAKMMAGEKDFGRRNELNDRAVKAFRAAAPGLTELPCATGEPAHLYRMTASARGSGMGAFRFRPPAVGQRYRLFVDAYALDRGNARSATDHDHSHPAPIETMTVLPVEGDLLSSYRYHEHEHPDVPFLPNPSYHMFLRLGTTNAIAGGRECMVYCDTRGDEAMPLFLRFNVEPIDPVPPPQTPALQQARATFQRGLDESAARSNVEARAVVRKYLVEIDKALKSTAVKRNPAETASLLAEANDFCGGDRAASDPAGLCILRAEYGEGDRWMDVTMPLRRLVRDDRLSYDPGPNAVNGFKPDPSYGKQKWLLVAYSVDGVPRFAHFTDLDKVDLPLKDPSAKP